MRFSQEVERVFGLNTDPCRIPGRLDKVLRLCQNALAKSSVVTPPARENTGAVRSIPGALARTKAGRQSRTKHP